MVLVVCPIDSPENEMLASCAGWFSVRVTRATRRLTAASEYRIWGSMFARISPSVTDRMTRTKRLSARLRSSACCTLSCTLTLTLRGARCQDEAPVVEAEHERLGELCPVGRGQPRARSRIAETTDLHAADRDSVGDRMALGGVVGKRPPRAPASSTTITAATAMNERLFTARRYPRNPERYATWTSVPIGVYGQT